MAVDSYQPKIAEFAISGTGKQLISMYFSADLRLKIDLSQIDNPGLYEHAFSPLDIYPLDHHQYKDLQFSTGDQCIIIVKNKI